MGNFYLAVVRSLVKIQMGSNAIPMSFKSKNRLHKACGGLTVKGNYDSIKEFKYANTSSNVQVTLLENSILSMV